MRHPRHLEPPERFPVRFYLIAMIFIVFDIEIIFFKPVHPGVRGAGLVRPRRHRHLHGRGVRVVPVPGQQRGARSAAAAPAPLPAARASRTAPPPTRCARAGLEGRADPDAGTDAVSSEAHSEVTDVQTDVERDRDGRGPPDGPRPERRDDGFAGLEHNFLTGQPRGPGPLGPPSQQLARHLRPGLLRHRDDGPGGPHFDMARFGMEVFRASPPGRRDDRRRPGPQKMAPVLHHLRPDDGAQVGHLHGRVRRRAACSTTTRSSRGVDQVVPVDVYAPVVRRAPRRCCTPSSPCTARSRPARSSAVARHNGGALAWWSSSSTAERGWRPVPAEPVTASAAPGN